MPRAMPALSMEFGQSASEAVGLAAAGDMIATTSPAGSLIRREWHYTRIELLYEMAFLRLFTEWESFLEQSLLRYMCGYFSPRCTPVAVNGNVFRNLRSAEAAILGQRRYQLWYDPGKVADWAARHLRNSAYEAVLRSNATRIEYLACVRHRIAHSQADAAQQFNHATMQLCGQRYRGARPGKFLRDWDSSVSPAQRWLASLATELTNLAGQMA
jgi:hypothetical protein